MPVIVYRRNKCIGCNYCTEHAPDFWRMSKKDGKSVLLNSIEKSGRWNLRISDADVEANKKAAEACPVRVIEVNL